MKQSGKLMVLATLLLFVGGLHGCVMNKTNPPSPTAQSSPSPSVQPASSPARFQLTLAMLDALLGNDQFVAALKTKLQISDEQIATLQQTASAEVNRLRTSNAEETEATSLDQRSRANEQIAKVIGSDKTAQLGTLTEEFWTGNNSDSPTTKLEGLPTTPNSIPTDTRIVVNIPAFRMDLFKDGSLIKSYRIGIGYPEFPLPQGLRKAQTIIFNPTWTPPDSPWVAKMKNVTPGEKIEAGSKLNPLGPIKIPIGMPSLIHGGKSPAKLGTFASHGCVGLTTAQVKDFARMLGQISQTDLSNAAINDYLQDPTQTKVVKLKETIPVELRYETIVVEDGKLHIYKDVYDENTNTEDNLKAVLEAQGVQLDSVPDAEKQNILRALNEMSAHPSQLAEASPSPTPTDKSTKKNAKSQAKAGKKQKEVVIELSSLTAKGYPAPVDLDTGTGKPVAAKANAL